MRKQTKLKTSYSKESSDHYQVTIIGTGNVAYHLADRFSNRGHHITIVCRSREKGESFCSEIGKEFSLIFDDSHLVSDQDFVILAVPDKQVSKVLEKYNFENTILLHASGALDMEIFKGKSSSHGVLYPFQTFTKKKAVDFAQIPILIEGSDEKVLTKIQKLAQELGPKVYQLPSTERLKVHLAAVFACNFTNNLFAITDSLLKGSPLQLNDFKHLIDETVQKALELSPQKAQTGPAIRNDQEVMQKHLELLEDEDLKQLYMLHSKLIRGD